MKCASCGVLLDGEEQEHPERDGDGNPICDECYREEFMDVCERCQDWTNKTDLDSQPGTLIVVFSAAPARGGDGDLQPGYYRVVSWPFFANGMFEGHFYAAALRRVAELDERGLKAALLCASMGAPLCGACRVQIETSLKEPA